MTDSWAMSPDPGGTGDGIDERDAGGRTLTRMPSLASIRSGVSEAGIFMNMSRLNALKLSVAKHDENLAKILLSSKESLEKRSQIAAAFRVCKEAFMEVTTVLANLIEEKVKGSSLMEDMKKAVTEKHCVNMVQVMRSIKW